MFQKYGECKQETTKKNQKFKPRYYRRKTEMQKLSLHILCWKGVLMASLKTVSKSDINQQKLADSFEQAGFRSREC